MKTFPITFTPTNVLTKKYPALAAISALNLEEVRREVLVYITLCPVLYFCWCFEDSNLFIRNNGDETVASRPY